MIKKENRLLGNALGNPQMMHDKSRRAPTGKSQRNTGNILYYVTTRLGDTL